jgi:hypothetical protein
MYADPHAPSAQLLRRLAEVADGYRTGSRIFLIASEQDLSIDVAHSQEEAEAIRSERGADFHVFGPYLTPADPAAGMQVPRIQRIQVTLDDGHTFDVDINEYDCIFWRMSALEKFVFPYYARVYGPETTVELQNLCRTHSCCGHYRSMVLGLPGAGGQAHTLDVSE